jgi:hypothetical protein
LGNVTGILKSVRIHNYRVDIMDMSTSELKAEQYSLHGIWCGCPEIGPLWEAIEEVDSLADEATARAGQMLRGEDVRVRPIVDEWVTALREYKDRVIGLMSEGHIFAMGEGDDVSIYCSKCSTEIPMPKYQHKPWKD